MSEYGEFNFELPDEIRRQDSEWGTSLPKGWGLTRTRNRILGNPVSGTHMLWTYGPPITTTTAFKGSGVERTVDAKHWAWKYGRRTPFSDWDTGGPFDSRKVAVTLDTESSGPYRAVNGQVWESYSGPLIAHDDVLHLLRNLVSPATADLPYPYRGEMPGASANEFITRGATAIARTLPTAPSVSIAQTLGELKEGLPSLSGRALGRGDVGGEYLNTQFGILPTVSDVKAYRDVAEKAEEILAQWRRDSGRRVRRRYTFAPEPPKVDRTVTSGNLSGTHGGFPYAVVNYGGTVTTTRATTQEWWFSGGYRYYIPEAASRLKQKMQELTRLYGVPTPDALWELTPFSWLVDWETNFGDVLANVSQLGHDDLVLTYGYIMCHSRVVYEYVWEGEVYYGNTPTPLQVKNSVVLDVKQRQGASPYGLGWTVDSLSDRQWAILGALGLTMARR